MTITLYSKPACTQCDATYRALLFAGVNFDTNVEIIALQDDKDAIAFVMSLGHRQAPVVVFGEEHWSGYRPDRIKALVATLEARGVVLTPRNPRDRADCAAVDEMMKAIKASVLIAA